MKNIEGLELDADGVKLVNDLIEFAEVLGGERAEEFTNILESMLTSAKELYVEHENLLEENNDLRSEVLKLRQLVN